MQNRIKTALLSAVAGVALTGGVAAEPYVFRARPATIGGSAQVPGTPTPTEPSPVDPAPSDPGEPAPQPNPQPFDFADLSEVEPFAMALSAPVLVSGYVGGSLIVQGGEYQICSTSSCSGQAAWRSDRATGLPAEFWARVRVPTQGYMTTSGVALTATVAGKSTVVDFEATVRAQDFSPDNFEFRAIGNVEPGEWAVSTPVALEGFEDSIAISATGGEISLDGGLTWVASGRGEVGDTVVARVRSSPSFGGNSYVWVTAGNAPAVYFQATTRAQDRLPDTFSFASVSNAQPGEWAVSAPVAVKGFEGTVSVAASGGEVSVDGGQSWFTSASLSPGGSVIARVRASAQFGGQAQARVAVGTSSPVTFTATTRARDVTPDAFTIPSRTGVNPDSEITSAAVTVNGFEGSVSISVDGMGESAEILDPNSGDWTDGASIASGQSFQVRTRSGSREGDVVTVYVTVGTRTVSFTVRNYSS